MQSRFNKGRRPSRKSTSSGPSSEVTGGVVHGAREALTQITEIRLQMARTEVFRGYRAVPAAFSGVVALAAASVQALVVQDPIQQINAYLTIWIGAAVVSGLSAVLEMGVRARNATSPLTRELTYLAIEQFFPCLVAGAGHPGRGAFGTRSRLDVTRPLASALQPGHLRVVPAVAPVDVRRGRLLLAFRALHPGDQQGRHVLSPWTMGLPFGVGQLLAAGVLYRTLERDHDT